MKQIKINVPEGYEIASFNKKTGKVIFKAIVSENIMDRIKTVDDILNYHNLTMRDIDESFEFVPQHLKYQYMAELLASALNEGWKPDWDDSNEDKYYFWFEMGGSSGFRFIDYVDWRSCSSVGSRLCFKSRELCEYAGKQFTELYKKFMLIEDGN